MSEKEWSKNRTPRAIAMLLHIKQAAIEDKNNPMWLDVCGYGCLAVAHNIDALIEDYNRTKTDLAESEHMQNVYKSICKEWEEIGFSSTPADMYEGRLTELKALAEKWRKEDEADDV